MLKVEFLDKWQFIEMTISGQITDSAIMNIIALQYSKSENSPWKFHFNTNNILRLKIPSLKP